jgi:hypothetical protein
VLLQEERAALRRLDADAVVAFAEEKETLVRALVAIAGGDRASDEAANGDGAASPPRPETVEVPAPERMRALQADLRRNAVLLAHARDCLRDTLRAAQAGLLEGAPGRERITTGVHVSTRG